jgi:hypothetical protein
MCCSSQPPSRLSVKLQLGPKPVPSKPTFLSNDPSINSLLQGLSGPILGLQAGPTFGAHEWAAVGVAHQQVRLHQR